MPYPKTEEGRRKRREAAAKVDKVLLAAKRRDRYQREKAIVSAKAKKARLLQMSNSPELYIYNQLKRNARKRGQDFNLVMSDIVLPTTCPILGIPISFCKGKPGNNSWSVDRIDRSLGYVTGNIQIVSYQANAMKRDATPEELHKFADWVKRAIPI